MGSKSGWRIPCGSVGITYVRWCNRGRVPGSWVHLKVVVKDHSANRCFHVVSLVFVGDFRGRHLPQCTRSHICAAGPAGQAYVSATGMFIMPLAGTVPIFHYLRYNFGQGNQSMSIWSM